MEDLGNERRAVAARLREMNIEPVNAEDLPPDGLASWPRLESEIKTCQLFILISGRSYGWIPTHGPGACEKRSVTHMETNAAKESGLIVLPFFMTIKPNENPSDDSRARDNFRAEIAKWESGYFRQMFSWADELADLVGQSIATVLGQALRREFEAHAAQASVQQAQRMDGLPTDLHTIIARADWISPKTVLMAGAGMSIAAGYPTAASLTQSLMKPMEASEPAPNQLARHDFAAVAQSFESRFGRHLLLERMSAALIHTDAFGPTRAHISAVRVFDTIVTTNLDLLFESACQAVAIPFTVITPQQAMPVERHVGKIIFKLHGSIDKPDSLVLTTQDVARTSTAWFWDAIMQRLTGHPLVVVGHALRDPVGKRVPDIRVHRGGAYVTPFLGDEETLLLAQYGFTGVRAEADSFMIAYEQALASRRV